ncbi:MAG: hypothetical protein OXR73_01375 [Myxococcales bacterium]|nr:hypothetical protein [Myxococcales bacterium]
MTLEQGSGVQRGAGLMSHVFGISAARRAGLDGQTSDVARVWLDGGLTVAAVAGGADCGWSVYFAPASRLLLDVAMDAWKATSGASEERVKQAATQIGGRFPEEVCELIPNEEDAYETFGAPGGSLVMAVADTTVVWVAWLGGEGAALVRHSKIVAATAPHTMKNGYRGQLSAGQIAALPDVYTGYLSVDAADRKMEHVSAGWAAEPGDRLVLLNREAQRAITVRDLEASCAREPGVGELAANVVELTMDRGATSAASIVVQWPTRPGAAT